MSARFQLDRTSPRRARAFAETILRNARVDDTTRETVRLLVSEVVTNAITVRVYSLQA